MALFTAKDLPKAYRALVLHDLRSGRYTKEETVAAMGSRRSRRHLVALLADEMRLCLRLQWNDYVQRWRERAGLPTGEGRNRMKPIELVERPYVPEDDRKLKPEDQTTFWIRPIEYPVYVQVLNAMARGHGGLTDLSLQLGTQEKIALLAGIVRIDNFKDRKGKLLSWPDKEEDRLNFLSIIPGKVRGEVAAEIRADQKMDDEQKGESDSRSLSQAPGTASAAAPAPSGATAAAG